MASSKQVLVVIVVVTIATILAAPRLALAADILVGDSQGWSLDCEYDDWVESNSFNVGDTLVFRYPADQHTVVQAASAASYAACSQANSLGVWTSGNDRVTLNASGDWWFFCGVGDHCQDGMKFTITVLPAVKLSSSSPPPVRASSGGVVAAGLAGVAAVVVALLF